MGNVATSIASPETVLTFWREAGPDKWFTRDDEFDADIREKFLATYEAAAAGQLAAWEASAEGALALAIVLDQFPRNMFRGHADAFSTDHLALAIAKGAVDKGLDEELQKPERKFLYMPFLHSETLENQDRALLLFTKIADVEQIKYAHHHRDLIARFGRFPHRNAFLGRTSRPDEIAAGADDQQ